MMKTTDNTSESDGVGSDGQSKTANEIKAAMQWNSTDWSAYDHEALDRLFEALHWQNFREAYEAYLEITQIKKSKR